MLGSIQQRVQNWFAARPFAKSVTVLAGGTAAAQIIALLAAPVLTRMYSVADFGYLQAYMSLMNLGIIAATMRYEMASLLPDDETTAASVRATAFVSTVVVSIASAGLLFALRQQAWFASRVSYGPVITWLFPVAIASAGFLQIATHWGIRDKSFSAVARSKFTQVGVQVGTQIGFAPLGWGAPALVAGDVLGRICSGLLLVRSCIRNAKAKGKVTRASVMQAARRYKDFPLVSTGAALLNTAGFAVPPLLIGYLYGAKALGFYALVDRIMGAPVLLVGQGVSQVYMSEVARLISTSPRAVLTLLDRTMFRLLRVAAIPSVLLILVAPSAFSVIFGPAWREAGFYAQLLALRQVMAFAVWPISMTLNLIEEQRLQFVWDGGRTVLTVLAIWLPAHFGMNAWVAIAAYSGVMFLGYISYAMLCRSVLAKRKAPEAAVEPVAAHVAGV